MNCEFINKGSDINTLSFIYNHLPEGLRKSINRSNLVPEIVTVKGKHGSYQSVRYKSKGKNIFVSSPEGVKLLESLQKPVSFREKLKDRFTGLVTSDGVTIVSQDVKHLKGRRHFKPSEFPFDEIEDALKNPDIVKPGNSSKGKSTVYITENMTVVVANYTFTSEDHVKTFEKGQGELKTAYLTNRSTSKRIRESKNQEVLENEKTA